MGEGQAMMDAKTIARFRKVCGLLGSTHDGERAAAGARATAMLKAAGKSWADVGVGSANIESMAVAFQQAALWRRLLDDERERTTHMANEMLRLQEEIGRLKREIARLKGMWPKGKPRAAA
jgi:hypothetical protein